MSRYIDADEALRMIRNSQQDNPCESPYKGIWHTAHESCISCVDAVPTADVVEVVRCKDCKHCRPSVLYIGQCYCENSLSPWYNDHFDVAMSITDFCSYGERREG